MSALKLLQIFGHYNFTLIKKCVLCFISYARMYVGTCCSKTKTKSRDMKLLTFIH
jgi:hypothetical protein